MRDLITEGAVVCVPPMYATQRVRLANRLDEGKGKKRVPSVTTPNVDASLQLH